MTADVLTIRQTRDEVTFAAGGDERSIRLDRTKIRTRARSFVDKVNDRTAGLRMDAGAALKAVQALSEAAYQTLVGSALDTFPEAAQSWEVVTSWLRRVPGTRGGKPPARVVEIVATDSSEYLPWEWMGPRPGLAPSVGTEDESRLMVAAGELLGMARCRRIYGTEVDRPPLRPIDEAMQVRGFFNRGLPMAAREIEYFREPRFRLVGPLPSQSFGFGGVLADHLFDPAYPFGSDAPPGRDEVVHFCCHHGTRDSVSRDFDDIPPSVLEFDATTTVDSDTLEGELGARWFGPDRRARPLVFLNLCDGEMHPGTLASLTRLFVRNDNPTVIGTSAIVRDRVAGAFMRRFYDRYRGSETAGDALWYAKYWLLEKKHNPFGLLYTLCGDPSLRVVDTTR